MPRNNRPKQYTEFVRLRLSREQFFKLNIISLSKGTSLSAELRAAVEQYITNIENVAVPIVTEYAKLSEQLNKDNCYK